MSRGTPFVFCCVKVPQKEQFKILVVPYEITLYTGDVKDAGTDAHIFVKVFGVGGSSSDIMLEKHSERFERGRIDLIKV